MVHQWIAGLLLHHPDLFLLATALTILNVLLEDHTSYCCVMVAIRSSWASTMEVTTIWTSCSSFTPCRRSKGVSWSQDLLPWFWEQSPWWGHEKLVKTEADTVAVPNLFGHHCCCWDEGPPCSYCLLRRCTQVFEGLYLLPVVLHLDLCCIRFNGVERDFVLVHADFYTMYACTGSRFAGEVMSLLLPTIRLKPLAKWRLLSALPQKEVEV